MASLFFFTFLIFLFLTGMMMQVEMANGTNIHVVNNCGETVCARYWVPNNGVGGGCRELGAGQAWDVAASGAWQGGTMWATPGTCGTGTGGTCNTGPPSGVTQFEFTIAGFSNYDYYDTSIKAGFNFGISVSPTNSACPSQSCLSPSSCQGFVDPNGPDRTLSCGHASTDYVLQFF